MDKKKITILLSLCAVAIVAVDGQEAFYGQACNETKCATSNINDPLECDDTKKVCRCPEKMFRHDELDRCVSPHNEACTLQSGDGSQIITCTDFAQCWPNIQKTSTFGTCHCDQDAAFDDITWKCKLRHGSTRCKKETDCDIKSLLTCKEGSCVCQDEENQEFSDEKQKCITKVNGPCAKVDPYPVPECGNFMTCNNVTCECNEGFEATPDRTCGKQYNATCEDTPECHPQFICNTEKKCACGETQEYYQGSCRILSGGACGTNDPSFNCTLHATCINEKCVCDADDYKEDPGTKKCIALHGAECSEETPCSLDDFLECKADNTCQCKDSYEFNNAQKRCKGHIGQTCRDNNNDDCIANSICSNNNCACSSGQVGDESLTLCVALFGESCDSETPCSDKHFVSCKDDSKCGCVDPEHQIPNEIACVGKVNSPCGEAGLGIPCVTNSTCSVDSQTCKCDSGFVENEGKCIAQNTSGSSNVFSSWGNLLIFATGVLIMGKL